MSRILANVEKMADFSFQKERISNIRWVTTSKHDIDFWLTANIVDQRLQELLNFVITESAVD